MLRLRELREERKVTQLQIAEALHIKQNTYSQYETGQRQIPIELLIAVADFYNVSVDYVLCLTDEEDRYPRPLK
ncbi:MAG TPA: helix-turn-helix transcriptional regulator [Candidatus Coproplasma stercoripullorum]|uniref:Helix-turn-helix transcriptional regulator n=1 Tax=Candidatus Coproplasma stercoripullorum TaxID=2840751 RepID=A0A9D1DC18_9FIRM|nr:helix-turn-helix transcriptional regulator [Candidatus Coproplasma stercoripullorum]